ncbi:AraC family transcriptional regulator [Psychromicrobium sp. YIM B11713]|uniref:AraC family transcriptional regulator n=1 Tax=Psychromicrobium sp. YIM B11713 TaxID=3145233 RepID=UPI00374F8C87
MINMQIGKSRVNIGNAQPREVEFFDNPNSAGGVETLALSTLREQAPPGEFRSPQRPQFFILLYIDSGALDQLVDFHRIELRPASLLLIHPGQLVLWGDLNAAEGHCVLFKPDALSPQLAASLPSPYENNHWRLGSALAQAFSCQFELLESYPTARRGDQLRAALLHHQLSAMLLHLNLSSSPTASDSTPGYQHHKRFRATLEANFDRHRDVAWYAKELGVSLRTLRNACQEATSMSPKQIIDLRVHLEAKRYLTHSEVSVLELSRILHFRDGSNFSSFFKQLEGLSPRDFRRQQRLSVLLRQNAP